MSAYLLLSVGAYVGSVAFCGAVCMCGDSAESDVLGRANYALTVWLPATLQSLALRMPWLGPRLVSGSEAVYDYVCCKPNPLLQLMYVVLLWGGCGLFLVEAYQHIPNQYMGAWHRWTGYLCMGVTMLSFGVASMYGPGRISEATLAKYSHYPYDGFVYTNRAKCETCGVRKPARSKHDRMSGVCVPRFDHYCPWIANTVGEENYRYFLFFVGMNAALLSYGTAALLCIFASLVQKLRLFEASFVHRETGERVLATKMIVVQYLFANYGYLVGLLILCAVMAVALVGFFLYHVYLIAVGTTSNETYKWSSVQAFYARRKKESVKKAKEAAKPEDSESDAAVDADKPAKTLAELVHPGAPTLYDRNEDEWPEEIPANAYNLGIATNLGEVLWPRCNRVAGDPGGGTSPAAGSVAATFGGARRRNKRKSKIR